MKIMPSHPSFEKLNTLNRILCIAVNREPRTEFEHMPEDERVEFIDNVKLVIQQEIEANIRSLN